jgi:hypothetical protein
MKIITFYNSRKLKLVGNLYSVDSKSLVIIAHGFTNDKFSNGRFEKLASAWNSIGHNAFAFDFSRCGESEQDFITVSNQVDDLKSAMNLFIEEEVELLEKSKKGMKHLSESSRLEILHGEKHGLRNKWDDVVEMTKNWLLKYL